MPTCLFWSKTSENINDVIERPSYVFVPNSGLFYLSETKNHDKVCTQVNENDLSEHENNVIMEQLKLTNFIPIPYIDSPQFIYSLTNEQLELIQNISGHNVAIDQSSVIDAINEYLSFNDLEIKANHQGICNGLVAKFCKAALQGKTKVDEFLNFERQVKNKSATKDFTEESKLSLFISETLFANLPDKYDTNITQINAIEQLTISNPDNLNEYQNISIRYNTCAIASKEKWIDIINRLKINNGTYIFSVITHTVGMRFFSGKNDEPGKFMVYDPNNPRGLQSFTSTAALVKSLFANFGNEVKEDLSHERLGLSISIVEHPFKPLYFDPPTQEELLELFDRENVNFFNDIKKTLILAARNDNVEVIELMLKKGVTVDFTSLQQAIYYNSHHAIPVLLNNFSISHSETYFACKIALESGRVSAFNALMKDPNIESYFHLADYAEKKNYLLAAAGSGSTLCIELLMEHFQPSEIPKIICESNAIQIAIEKSGRTASVAKLIELAVSTEEEKQLYFTQSRITDFFNTAVKTNRYSMVHFLLATFPEQSKIAAQSIPITPGVFVKETSIRIIDKLISSGAPLTDEAAAEVHAKKLTRLSVNDREGKDLENEEPVFSIKT